ncbi:hypothetical protein D3C73_1146730 [compost metagenome]
MLHYGEHDTDEECAPDAGSEQLLERIAFIVERLLDVENFLLSGFFPMDFHQDRQRFIGPVPFDEPSGTFGYEQHQEHEQQSRNSPHSEHPAPGGRNIPSFVSHADNPQIQKVNQEYA